MPRPNFTWKSAAKLALALVILGFVGRQFYRDLNHPDSATLHFRWPWAVLAGFLYLSALSFSAWFWRSVLKGLGQRPGWFHPFRAYFLGHLGKYVPGKAWALLLRGSLVKPDGVPLGLAILTSFYEVLTTMATGALVAICIFLLIPPQVTGLGWHPLYTALLLVGLLGAPLLPGVFNFLLRRLSNRFPGIVGTELPPLRNITLLRGIAATACGWGMLGMSVWSMLQAVLPEPPPLTFEFWAQCTAANALAYVAGFLAVFMPSGVGVREYFLLTLLAFAGPEPLTEPLIAVAVLLLRVTWTVSELTLAGLFMLIRRGAPNVPNTREMTPSRIGDPGEEGRSG